MKPIYRFFSDEEYYDFSEESEYEAFMYESRGKGDHKLGVMQDRGKPNGYIVGKHWMDVTVKMWREDIKRNLLKKSELYNDPEFKDFHWWLDRVLKGL